VLNGAMLVTVISDHEPIQRRSTIDNGAGIPRQRWSTFWAARIPVRRLDGGIRHWAIVASLVAIAKLNGVEPLAWLTDVLERMVSGRTKTHELERLLPWHWKTEQLAVAVNA
jgi:hypothetical protein